MRPIPICAIAALTALGAGHALAQEAPAAAESTAGLSANVGLVTLYKYRGQDQYIGHSGKERWLRPAIQGGLDYDFGNGFYVGNWNSSLRLPSSKVVIG